MRRASKYHAIRTRVDGINFASKREAKRYGELKLMQKAGKITHLLTQVPFVVFLNGIKICTYKADFVYYEGALRKVEDSKGFRTPVYALKKKMVEAQYGIRIEEV